MNDTNKMRDVYVAVADPTRRELIRLLADVEEFAKLRMIILDCQLIKKLKRGVL